MISARSTPISNRGLHSQFLRIPYYNPLVLPDMTCSIDNARIRYTYRKKSYIMERAAFSDTLEFLMEQLSSDSIFLEFQFGFFHKEMNFRLGCYAHTFSFQLPDGGSFAILFGRYTYSTTDRGIAPEAVLDFNPNKTYSPLLLRVLGILQAYAAEVTVQRFDLALDFFVQRDTLQLVRRAGSGYQRFVDTHGIITEYTGNRSHHAAIKLYDKAAEVGLSCPVTRLEITIEWAKFSSVSVLMPTIVSSAPLEFNLGFSDLPFPVKAVMIHPDLYEVLKDSVAPNTWTKYKGLLRDNGNIAFSVPSDTLRQIDSYVYSYIVNLPKIHLL